MRKDLPQPPLRPAVLLAGRSSTDERAFPPRPQAMEGSPEGLVPLALSAQDRPPRRRIKRQSPALTSIAEANIPSAKCAKNRPGILLLSRKMCFVGEILVDAWCFL